MRRKKVLINTDAPYIFSGLGKAGKNLAKYLYKTGKYELIYLACGTNYGHPQHQRVPYKCFGALPDHPAEVEQMKAQGEGFFRAMSYGAGTCDRVINEQKPDVLIASNDSWAMDFYTEKPWSKVLSTIYHVTIDSLPFLPQQVELFKKAANAYVWAPFAEKEAKRLELNHVKTLFPIIDVSNFKRLSEEARKQLRKKHNIPEDAFIVVKCSRNQIRKRFTDLIESYAKWKKIYKPTKPTYLLFNTNFSEPGGWRFHEVCDQHGVDKKELLTSYICHHCKSYEVRAFDGNDKDCSACGTQKSLHNLNIEQSPSEEQLNEIYNLADCMVHLADAAGLEMSMTEGLAVGIPCATNDYASLQTFTAQDFVTKISCSFTTQLGTQFKRAVPDQSDIVNFLNKIYNMAAGQRIEIGKKGSKWIRETFSEEAVGPKWEEAIDKLPFVDWDKIKIAPMVGKNPNAEIPQIGDDKTWLTALYNLILGCQPDDNGMNYWLGEIQKGLPRGQIETFFRGEAAKGGGQMKYEDMLLKNGKKNVLIVLKESIGDIIISTALLKSFRISYPASEYNIYFGCDPKYFEILDGNPNLDGVLPYHPFMESEIHCTGQGTQQGMFNVYVNLGILTQRQLGYLTNDNLAVKLKD